ncbi:MAG: SDR family oxidoreductase [Lentisphaerae bacterium]|jgi:NAD(P)-dependent dehydrogenase (short-subunit alcohol dehydrogenase family)|nr:SDR family oxidoreductase [Lentisphaerota bacterium]MBT4821851.1 SDR family oxidoreductase [Lentisphaerota bacterium]MBT5605492.1 SDR family oxidoreductase [Lentisphaerota bacterium]MBT7060077.1 SDR family oxidoreductase [Lentisphaerota bacterium]MBT7840863.1 SDR family oxidoreductase [Lentisphaerota bacterium]
MGLEGKTAIVTGGAQGIGKCTALSLLREGMNVIIADVDTEAGLECVADHMPAGQIQFVPTDVGNETAVANCVRRAVELFGGVDALVNNAGVGIERKIEDLSLDEWNRAISTNLTGCFLMVKYAIPYLRESQGAIVNVASVKGLQAVVAEANSECYCAAKGGLIALTHALAISQGPNVRVNCISPGWINTAAAGGERLAACAEYAAAVDAEHPVGRVGQPEDVAGMVKYLLSDEAGFITGQNFIVDGGISKKIVFPV